MSSYGHNQQGPLLLKLNQVTEQDSPFTLTAAGKQYSHPLSPGAAAPSAFGTPHANPRGPTASMQPLREAFSRRNDGKDGTRAQMSPSSSRNTFPRRKQRLRGYQWPRGASPQSKRGWQQPRLCGICHRPFLASPIPSLQPGKSSKHKAERVPGRGNENQAGRQAGRHPEPWPGPSMPQLYRDATRSWEPSGERAKQR